mgnify:FL=1
MIERIEKKILEIREQPEAVRMRFLFLCLGIIFFFVVIICIFSLKESVNNLSQQELNISLPAMPVEKGKSLESLMENNESLKTKPEGKGVEEILQPEGQ